MIVSRGVGYGMLKHSTRARIRVEEHEAACEEAGWEKHRGSDS